MSFIQKRPNRCANTDIIVNMLFANTYLTFITVGNTTPYLIILHW
jgi:hypothetical protein